MHPQPLRSSGRHHHLDLPYGLAGCTSNTAINLSKMGRSLLHGSTVDDESRIITLRGKGKISGGGRKLGLLDSTSEVAAKERCKLVVRCLYNGCRYSRAPGVYRNPIAFRSCAQRTA